MTKIKRNFILSMMVVCALVVGAMFMTSCQPAKTYEDVYNEYSQKIKDETPKQVEAFNNEAKDVKDIKKLADISQDKIKKLADIETKGVQEMAEIMHKNGDEYKTYEDWSKKLYKVYEDCGKEITNAYMGKSKSAIGSATTQDLAKSTQDLQNLMDQYKK